MRVESLLVLAGIVFCAGCSEDSEKQTQSTVQSVSADTQKVESTKTSKPKVEQKKEINFEMMEIEEVKPALIKEMDLGNWALALKGARVLLEDDSEPLEYHFFHARILFEMERYPEAMSEFRYVLKMRAGATQNADSGQKKWGEEVSKYLEKAKAKAAEMAIKIHSLEEKEMVTQLFGITKLFPEIDFSKYPPAQGHARKKIYYIVQALEWLKKEQENHKGFWLSYQVSWFNFLQKWYGEARKSIDKALGLADSQSQIFFALQLQEAIDKEAPKEASSDLDKLSALDLTEDMLDEFMEKYSKDLTEKQIEKAREVIKMSMKIKDKLEKAQTDRDKLQIFKEFEKICEDVLSTEEFPKDIMTKVSKAREKSKKGLLELEEQIRIKEEALKEANM